MAKGTIAVVDYGVGNLKSVTNALDFLGLQTVITADAGEIRRADAVLLPGVGAFPDAYDHLARRGLPEILKEEAMRKPFLGICLGMQLLFDGSDEGRPTGGLGLVSGWVRRMETDRKLPHIGWNDLIYPRDSPLFKGIPQGSHVYFVHSFAGFLERPENAIATTLYGTEVLAAVRSGMVFGCQFHPEKSGEVGLAILKNFGELIT